MKKITLGLLLLINFSFSSFSQEFSYNCAEQYISKYRENTPLDGNTGLDIIHGFAGSAITMTPLISFPAAAPFIYGAGVIGYPIVQGIRRVSRNSKRRKYAEVMNLGFFINEVLKKEPSNILNQEYVKLYNTNLSDSTVMEIRDLISSSQKSLKKITRKLAKKGLSPKEVIHQLQDIYQGTSLCDGTITGDSSKVAKVKDILRYLKNNN